MSDPIRGNADGDPHVVTPETGNVDRDVFGQVPGARGMTAYIKPTLYVILIAYVIIFFLLNRQQVPVNFLFFSANARLIDALVISHIIGIVVGGGALMIKGRRDRKRGERRS